jgi:hypothetical protein
MTPSRFRRIDRRRLVASSVLGGAAIVTAGQLVRGGTRTSQPAALMMQDGSSDVPMFRGNAARTGEMPGPGPDDANGVEAIWTFATGDWVYYSSPAVVAGVVYVGSRDNHLYAVNAEDGTERWRFATGGEISSSPAVVDGVVYVGSSDGNLHALGARVPRLSVGGTARVTETISLRGGPAPTTVERAELTPETVVTITGESATTGDVVWWPVVVDETGEQGWIEASTLEPLTSGPPIPPSTEAP